MLVLPVSSPTLPTHLRTVEEFESWQRQPGNDGSFEFVRGRLIPRSMQQDEVDIVDFLVRRFAQTACFRQKHLLMPQADSYVDATRKRIPNLAYFTPEQRQAMRRGERVNTLFAIEILSESETHHPERRPDVLDKIQDYFDGGARLVWYIIPSHQRIDAYTSPENSTVFRGQQPITAAPVLPEFGFVVAELFA